MDENFEGFLEDFGPAVHKIDASTSSIDRYRGKLPDQLLEYWQKHGWCGYADGLFWTVDPYEYEPVLDAWIGDTPFMEQDTYYVIARSAFGDIYLFGERHHRKLHVIAPDARLLPPREGIQDSNLSIRAFFGSQTRNACDFSDVNGERLFTPAFKKLGCLQHDQMYGFVPALALGGAATIANLQIVSAVEHLVLLAGLSELRVMNTPTT
jgi:hypothetical protein